MISFCTALPSNVLPIKRFAANIVLLELDTACLLAGIPTNVSESVNATTLGVVLAPSVFSTTFASLPSIKATQELVVPKSIPIILLILSSPC